MEVIKTERFEEVKDNNGLVNCVMLIRYPLRKQMIQEAIAGFMAQDYGDKILTIVNDGFE